MDKLLDLTRDFDAAKAAFEAYLDEYDRADDKIHLKIVHTYGVVDAAEDIARRMGHGSQGCCMMSEDLNRLSDLTALNREPWSMQHMGHRFCSDRRK
mgnify:CR=1 FL=1